MHQPIPTAPSEFFTAPELAQRLRLKLPTIYTLVRRQHLPPPIRVGLRSMRWPREQIDAWLARGGTQ